MPLLVFVASAFGAAATGLLAVTRRQERGVLVALPILIGILVTLFVLGEFTSPH